MFQYDFILGKFHSTVTAQNEKKPIIKGKAISMFQDRDPINNT